MIFILWFITFVNANFIEPRFSKEPKDLNVIISHYAAMPCEVEQRKESELFWVKDRNNVTLIPNRRWVSENGTLHFSSVSFLDSGSYHCVVVWTGVGSLLSRKANIIVHPAAVNGSSVQPSAKTAFEGDSVLFTCIFQNASGKIRWFFSRDPRHFKPQRLTKGSNPRAHLLHDDNSVLEITAVNELDIGYYYCQLAGGNVSKSAFLAVKNRSFESELIREPHFDTRPSQLSVGKEGDNITLLCVINGVSEIDKGRINWFNRHGLIDFRGRYQRVGSNNLRIVNLRKEDSGRYICRASFHHRKILLMAVARLVINTFPTFVVKPKNQRVLVGENVMLTCQAKAYPRAAVNWLKNGKSIIPSMLAFSKGDSLYLRKLELSDGGFYQCTASNQIGNEQTFSQVIVQHYDKSSLKRRKRSADNSNIVHTPDDFQAAEIGDRYVFFKWSPPRGTPKLKRLTYRLILNVSSETSSRQVVLNDKLEYMAEKLLPDTEYTVSIAARYYKLPYGGEAVKTLRTRPARAVDDVLLPRLLIGSVQSSSSVLVTWDAPVQPSDASPIIGYSLRLVNMTDNSASTLNATESPMLLTNLQPQTRYQLLLKAINVRQAYSEAAVAFFETMSSVPSAAPINLNVSVIKQNALVKWSPPPLESHNGKIVRYKIKWYPSYLARINSNSAEENIVETSLLQFQLTRLIPGHEYNVLVAAMTLNGTGPFAGPVSVFIPESSSSSSNSAALMETIPRRKLLPPRNFNLRVKNNNILLTWSKGLNRLDRSSPVENYLIEWGRITPNDNQVEISGDKDAYLITDLEPNTEYKISITARNRFGSAQPILRVDVTRDRSTSSKDVNSMAADLLAIPMALNVEVTGSRDVKLSWADADVKREADMEGRFYQIEVKLEHESKANQHPFYMNTSVLSASLTTLRPATSYTARVRTFRQNAVSQWSLASSFLTPEEGPETPPADITFRAMPEPSSVHLSWQPPVEPNGHVKKYLVYYTADNRLDTNSWLLKTVSGDELNMVVTQLTNNIIYTFKMIAQNSKGFSPWSSLKLYKVPNHQGLHGGEIILIPGKNGQLESVLKTGLTPNFGPPSRDGTVLHVPPSSESPVKADENLSLADKTWWIVIGGVFLAAILLIVVIIVAICIRRPGVQHGRSVQQDTTTSNGYKPGSKLDAIHQQQQTQALLMQQQQGPPTMLLKSPPPDLFIHTQKTSVEQAAILEMRQFPSAGCGGGSVDGDSGSDRLLGGGSGSLGGRRDSSDGEGSDRGIFSNGGPYSVQFGQQQHVPSYLSRRAGNSHGRGKTLHMPLEVGRSAVQPVPALVTAVHGTPQHFVDAPRVNAADLSAASQFNYYSTSPNNLHFQLQQQQLPSHKKQQQQQQAIHHTRHSRQPSSETNHVASLTKPDVSSSGFDSATSDSAGEMSAVTAFSTEELIAEVANLEGLMKDLNVMTQKEFEC